LNDKQEFFRWVNLSIEDNSVEVDDLRNMPAFAHMRSDPGFQTALRELKIISS